MKKKYLIILLLQLIYVDAFTQKNSIFKPDSNSIKSKHNITFGFWPLVAAFSFPADSGGTLRRVTLGGKASIGYFFINHLDTKFIYEYNVIVDNKFGPWNHQSISISNQYILFNKKISPFIGFAPRLFRMRYKSYPSIIYYNDPINQMNIHNILLFTEKVGASFVFKRKFMFYAGLEFIQSISRKTGKRFHPPFVFDFNFSLHKKCKK